MIEANVPKTKPSNLQYTFIKALTVDYDMPKYVVVLIVYKHFKQ